MDDYLRTKKTRYALAVALTLLAALIRMAADPYLESDFPFSTFYVAITAIAIFAGPGPSLLASGLSFLAAKWFFITPRHTLYMTETTSVFGSVVFASVSLLITAIGCLACRLRERTEANARAAVESQKRAEEEADRRQQAEEKMRRTVDRLAEAERTALVMTIHVSLDGCWLKVPPNFCSFLGHSEEELVGRPFKDFTHPADFMADWNQVQRLKNGEIKSFQMEKRFIRKDGSVVWGYINCSIVMDEQGQPLHLLTFVLDINEKKLVEEELRYNVATLSLAVESTGIGTFDFYPEMGVLRWSDMTRRHFGLSSSAPVDYQVFLGGIHAEDRETVNRMIHQALEQEIELRAEFRTVGIEDGKERWIAMRGRVLYDLEGGPLRLIGTTLDMSQQKQAEEALKKTMADLSRSNLELAQFAYVASHDLQEPLRMVASYVQLLANRYQGQLDEKADTYINYAVDGAKRMQRLIEGLLAYSRITRGAEFKPVNTGKVVTEALANLDTAIKESGAHVEKDNLPTVFGDEIQLMQLFQNLIANGIKYRKAVGPVQIGIGAHLQQGEWQFWVKDNGIGIEAEHYGRIFQIFQRLHTRDEYSGTGIGLALCKRIVERHGGRIWVESRFGEGSTFFFTIPAMKGFFKK